MKNIMKYHEHTDFQELSRSTSCFLSPHGSPHPPALSTQDDPTCGGPRPSCLASGLPLR